MGGDEEMIRKYSSRKEKTERSALRTTEALQNPELLE